MSDNRTRNPTQAQPSAPTREQQQRARDEAAAWYAKMRGPRISHREVTDFYAWREDSLNDAAYGRIEALTAGVRVHAGDPRLQAIAQAANDRRAASAPLAWLRRGATPWITGMAVAAAVVVGAVTLVHPFGQTYRTGVGEHRLVALADGSTIDLNTDSVVRVRLTRERRAISLDKGQALFAVAHDAARPFIVTAGDTAVRAVGTRFEVYRTGAVVRVTLAEGKVQVTQGNAPSPTMMRAGTRLDVGGKAPARPVAVDVAAATGWTDGRLTFQDTPLAQAVAEANRYSRKKVALGPGAPADERVTAIFNAGDTTAFVDGVSKLLDLKSAIRADGTIELTGLERPVAAPVAPES
ncbi:FecR domain-containing protein [Caulobacter sp. FWC2]|uniref:FecR family protein n=1 Tax=Caulobacter sp. FWC2 TaxID=69664 RepID=UPI000C15C85E|nr:FecR domain-containing protein [Caulobacter sp. FWC2]PIB92752.1 iron dicitrate transport regulator FecR [Caulobacter sp. FWC2]